MIIGPLESLSSPLIVSHVTRKKKEIRPEGGNTLSCSRENIFKRQMIFQRNKITIKLISNLRFYDAINV